MKCLMKSWLRPLNSWASVTFPVGLSNSYGLSILTHGNSRRCRFSSSRALVSSFSRVSRSLRASSHSSRETIGLRFTIRPPVSFSSSFKRWRRRPMRDIARAFPACIPNRTVHSNSRSPRSTNAPRQSRRTRSPPHQSCRCGWYCRRTRTSSADCSRPRSRSPGDVWSLALVCPRGFQLIFSARYIVVRPILKSTNSPTRKRGINPHFGIIRNLGQAALRKTHVLAVDEYVDVAADIVLIVEHPLPDSRIVAPEHQERLAHRHWQVDRNLHLDYFFVAGKSSDRRWQMEQHRLSSRDLDRLYAQHSGQPVGDRIPAFSLVTRREQLSAASAEIEPRGIEPVRHERVAQHREIAVAIRQSLAEGFPRFARVARAPHLDRALERHAKNIRLERYQVRGIAAVWMRDQRKAKLGRQPLMDIDPRIAAVVGAVNSGMVLQIDPLRIFRVESHLVRALRTEMRRVRRTALHLHAVVASRPRLTAVVAAIHPGRRNSNHDALGIPWMDQNRMQTEPAGPRHP